jgi:hypothetical protein
MKDKARITAEFAAIMLGGELVDGPVDPDTPLGRFLDSDQDSAAVLRAWAESGVTPETLRNLDLGR